MDNPNYNGHALSETEIYDTLYADYASCLRMESHESSYMVESLRRWARVLHAEQVAKAEEMGRKFWAMHVNSIRDYSCPTAEDAARPIPTYGTPENWKVYELIPVEVGHEG